MNDVLDRLAALRPLPDQLATPATDDIVAADLRRGRRALARRRAVRGAGVGVVAAATVAIAATTLGNGPAPHGGLDLVAYHGAQLPGFTVARVPEGFVLQGATAYSLDVARAGDTTSLDVFEGKLVVSLEAAPGSAAGPAPGSAPVRVERVDGTLRVHCPDGSTKTVTGPDARNDTVDVKSLCGVADRGTAPPVTGGEPIDVDGDSATLTTNGEGAKIVRYVHGDRAVVVQMWPGLGLSDAELREFADGITVTSEAQVSRG